MRYFYLLCLLTGFIPSALAGQFMQPNNLFPKVKLLTSHGDITIELDRSRAPITVNNFLSYVKHKRYDNTIFHRLEPDYVLQGGGFKPDWKPVEELKPIFNESGNGLKNRAGSVAMARLNDQHSATSQFYFNLQDNPSLDPGRRWGYTVFGQITEGLDVLEKIRQLETHTDEHTGWPNVPVEPVVLRMVLLLPE